MFHMRKRYPPNPERQLLPMQLEIAVEHEDLPSLGVDWSKRWFTVSNDFEENYEKVFNFDVRNDDIFIVTGTKSGTTWMMEIVWLLLNNLDYEKANQKAVGTDTVHLELSAIIKNYKPLSTLEMANDMPSPRIFKCHLPLSLLPKQCWKKKPKIIYIARNLKDYVVSSYHFYKGIQYWNGTMEEFVVDVMNNDFLFTPRLEHILDYWKIRHEPNIYFLTYEEMKLNLAVVIQKLCKFLDRPELTPIEMEQTLKHLSFENMKVHTYMNERVKAIAPTSDFKFMRRGIIGAYKDELSPELQEKLDKWCQDILSKENITEEDLFGSF